MNSNNIRFFLPFAVALTLGCQRPSPPAVTTSTATVTVEIKNGDVSDSFQIENVASGTTLESVMRSIDQVPVTIHGTGLTAFVDSIGDRATSSSEGWTFKVDGEFAHQGIGSTQLTPPTTVTWSYGDASEIAQE